MRGRTFVEQVLARASNRADVQAGEVVVIRPDMIFSHDNTAAIQQIFKSIGAHHIIRPERVAVTLDHAVPAPTTRHAQNHAEIRAWVEAQNIGHFFEVGRGICHQVISEEALILPGEVILGADSHSTHFGWLGAFGMGVGRSEMAALWATGELWIQMPEAVQIVINGRLRPGVTAKDLVLHILGRWGADGGAYRSVEFAGDTISSLSLDERAVIPNMMAEFGAMNAYLPPDEAIFDYLAAKQKRTFTPIYPDDNATYSETWHIHAETITPAVALPHRPDRVAALTDVVGQPIQQAFLGTCTNGRYSDLEAAAQVVANRRVTTRFIIIPASAEVLARAAQTGILKTLIDAGATISTPGCGPCMGNHMGIPAPQEATISTGNRNFRGRMGTADAPVYLSNAYVVAASALTGCITDPGDFL